MFTFTTDGVTSTVTLNKGYNTSINLTLECIEKVLESTSNEIHLGGGRKVLLLHTGDEEKGYIVRRYNKDMSVKASVCMSRGEWDCVVAHATDITQPPVHDEICTRCGSYEATDVHYGCIQNRLKIDVFLLTHFGKCAMDALKRAVVSRYNYLMSFEENCPGERVNYRNLKRAYAFIKRHTLVEEMGIDIKPLVQTGPADFPNENILKYDEHFKNFKMCAYSNIHACIDHDLEGGLMQSLDWPDSLDM